MTEVEHSIEECIGMLHHRPDAGDPDVSFYTFNGKLMIPDSAIHGAIQAFAFRSKVTPVPVTHNSQNG